VFLQPTTIFELFELFSKGALPYDDIVNLNSYLGLFLIISFQASTLNPVMSFFVYERGRLAVSKMFRVVDRLRVVLW